MTKQEIIGFLRTNPSGFLATIENGEPRVRGMMHFIASDDRIIYHTGKNKDLGKQVPDGSVVELCVFNPEVMTQVRVRGTVKTLNEPSLTEALIADRPFIKDALDAIGADKLLVIQVADAKATVWTMATNFAPKEWVELD